MALYFLGREEIFSELQQCCEEEVALLSLDTMGSNISEAGILFLDGEQDFLELEEALSIVRSNEAISVVVICSEAPALHFDHLLYLPLKKEITTKLISELETSSFKVTVGDAGDTKSMASLAKVNEVIDTVFSSEFDEFENLEDPFDTEEVVAMSDKKEEEKGLEFNIPESDKTEHAIEASSENLENESDIEMDIPGEVGLSLSEEGEEAESFTVSTDNENDLNLDIPDLSSPGIALGSKEESDNFEYNAEAIENSNDIDFDNPKMNVAASVAPTPIEEEALEDSSLDEEMSFDEDNATNDLDDLDGSELDDFDVEMSDDLADDIFSMDSDLEEGIEELVEDAPMEELEFSSEENQKEQMDESDEFSDVDLLFSGQDDDEELAKTRVVSTASHQIDEAQLDQTLNTMLFADSDNNESLQDMVSELGRDLDGVEELDFSSIEENEENVEQTKSITETDAGVLGRDQDSSIPAIHFSADENTQTELAATSPSKVIQDIDKAHMESTLAREEIVSVSQYAEDELLRLQGTIRQLREEREEFLQTIDELRGEQKLKDQDKTGLEAELDELRIELSILKKRHLAEMEELRYQWRLSEEKKDMYEQRAKNAQKEIDRLSSKIHIDINKVKQREKDLESQLELVTMDSESKVKSRDMKILELKRKIDALEFNMENVAIREHKLKEDKVKTEERLEKIMKTLRGSIKLLEDDVEYAGEDKEHKDRE